MMFGLSHFVHVTHASTFLNICTYRRWSILDHNDGYFLFILLIRHAFTSDVFDQVTVSRTENFRFSTHITWVIVELKLLKLKL